MHLDARSIGGARFEKILEAHHVEIHQYLRRVVSPEAEADGLPHETFLRGFRAYRSLSADVDVRTWLFALATRLCRNHSHGKRRRPAISTAREELRTADGDGVDGEAPAGRHRLGEIMGRLPVKQRLAVTMRKLHDLEYDAIGEGLGCSVETARDHVLKALRTIRRELEGIVTRPLGVRRQRRPKQ